MRNFLPFLIIYANSCIDCQPHKYCPRFVKNASIHLTYSFAFNNNNLRVRLSPFPRVESRFNTHNQNAFANAFRNAFLDYCCVYHRSLRITITSIQCVPEKQTPETKGCCDQVPTWPGCMPVVIPSS